MDSPANLLFTKEHEWARLNGSDATVGISDHAQHSLGDITFVDLPKVGTKVKKGAQFATVESVKAASDVYAPFSGEVVKVNGELVDSPDLINKSPYDNGWFVVIKVSDQGEKSDLMTDAQYKEYVEGLH
jgi:glycine cleavage system H protein